MGDWYMIPREYGGRTFPLHTRMYLEWLWRRHGQAGLDWYTAQIRRRVIVCIKEMELSFRKMTVEGIWTGIQFDRPVEAMRDAGIERNIRAG